jgi:hypothetical protein
MNTLAQTFHDALVGTFPRGPDGKTPQYPPRFCEWMNRVDNRVGGCECQWVAPYGFVVAAGCPNHD